MHPIWGKKFVHRTSLNATCPKSAPSAEPFTPSFRADRPFVFLIRDRTTGTILFLGRMMEPSVAKKS